MGTKAGGDCCYDNALPDEPMFVLLARDPEAPNLVRAWAMQRATDIGKGSRPVTDMPQVQEAYACANRMVEWRTKHDGEWRK